MNIVSVFKNVAMGSSKTAAKVAFKLKKAAPAIAVIGGTAGTVAAGVWAVKKTATDAPEVLDEIKKDISEVKEQNLGKRALAGAYVKGGFKIVKLYSGPIIIEAGSVFAILYGYNLVNGRLVAMGATAAALEETNRRTQQAINNYRQALAERYGADFEKDLFFEEGDMIVNFGDPKKAVPVEKTVDEDGNEHVEEGHWEFSRDVANPCDVISPYAVIFDETSSEWSTDPEYNKMTLHRIQQVCNDLLHARGHLFLNDVYHELGLPDTQYGQMVGWLDKGDGDGYVDFGIYDIAAVNNRREFINGYEPSIILDFNVDGVIWDKI